MRRWVPFLMVGLLAGGGIAAQEGEQREVERERTTNERERDTTDGEEATAERERTRVERTVDDVRERIRRAIRLPTATDDAREAGVDEERIREVLRSGRERRVPAGEMEEILEVENEAIREGREKDNYGAAVLEMKASGLKGRELAEAIHAEQLARGMKKPKQHGGEKGKAKGKGKGKGKERP